jgi:hypothetical protein
MSKVVHRATVCIALAEAASKPRPERGQPVNGAAEGTLLRIWVPQDKRRPMRALVDIGSTEVWVNERDIHLVETDAAKAQRIQDKAASMMRMWDKDMPGTLETYGQYFERQAMTLEIAVKVAGASA